MINTSKRTIEEFQQQTRKISQEIDQYRSLGDYNKLKAKLEDLEELVKYKQLSSLSEVKDIVTSTRIKKEDPFIIEMQKRLRRYEELGDLDT